MTFFNTNFDISVFRIWVQLTAVNVFLASMVVTVNPLLIHVQINHVKMVPHVTQLLLLRLISANVYQDIVELIVKLTLMNVLPTHVIMVCSHFSASVVLPQLV